MKKRTLSCPERDNAGKRSITPTIASLNFKVVDREGLQVINNTRMIITFDGQGLPKGISLIFVFREQDYVAWKKRF